MGMPSNNRVSSRNISIGTAVVCCAAALLPLAFIVLAGVNVPFADEWWYAGLVKSVKSGDATFQTFWLANNEHRMLIPKLEFSFLVILTHWNSKIIMLAAWFVMACAAAFLFLQFKRIYSKSHPLFWAASTFLGIAVLLSLVQHENWLWAFQFAFFFIQLSTLVSIFTICRSDTPISFRLLTAIPFAVAASYSSAQGLLLWPALVISLCLTNDSRRTKWVGAVWLIVSAVVTAWFYFLGLSRTSGLQLRSDQMTGKPQLPFVGFFGLAGNMLAGWISYEHRPHRSWLIGLGMTVILAALVVLLARRKKIAQAAPWLGLAVFAYAFCFVTTYGRLGLGYTGGFLASRYTTHISFLVIALLALLVLALDSISPQPAARSSTKNRFNLSLAFCLIFAIGALVVLGDIRAFATGMKEREDRRFARELIPFYPYFDPKVDGVMSGPFFPLCPVREKIFDIGLKPLVNEGYFNGVPTASLVGERSDLSGTYSVSANIEEHRYLGIVQHGWQLKGRVTIDAARYADIVFLKPNGTTLFIAAAKLHRLASSGGSGEFCEWSLFLSPLIFPDRNTPLQIWIFDRETNQFVKAMEQV
jgi:hypothetical protein